MKLYPLLLIGTWLWDVECTCRGREHHQLILFVHLTHLHIQHSHHHNWNDHYGCELVTRYQDYEVFVSVEQQNTLLINY